MDQSAGHKIALELEISQPAEQRLSGVQNIQPQQKRIAAMLLDNSREAYTKLIRTAYELALNPTLAMKQFKTLVKVQWQNGVWLIEGHNDGKAGREFISFYIADDVNEKCAAILASSHFMSVLTDRSQAR